MAAIIRQSGAVLDPADVAIGVQATPVDRQFNYPLIRSSVLR
jgi:hypothetical protein